MTTVRLTEATRLQEATPGANGMRRWRARIIEGDIWGSSGYYSRKVLERDGPIVWAEGTQMFVDHPGDFEESDRPERSVRDLAGRIASTPTYENDGLYADVEFFPHVAPIVEALADDIGLSIRAGAEVEYGEMAGRHGPIITRLVEGISVDLVTRAGAGGRLVSLIESARRATPARAAQVAEATANDTREALHAALKEQFGGDDTWIWVRDFDDTTVWFEVNTPDSAITYALGYAIDDDLVVTFDGAPLEVRATTTYVPVADPSVDEALKPPVIPAGSTTQESQEDTMTDAEREAQERQLAEATGRVSTLESERDAERVARQTAEARLVADRRARTALAENHADMPALAVERVVEAATTTVPLTQPDQAGDRVLDEAAFDIALEAARTREETYLTSLAETGGAGTPSGLGPDGKPAGDGISESELDSVLGIKTKEA